MVDSNIDLLLRNMFQNIDRFFVVVIQLFLKIDAQNITMPKWMILNVDFALKLSNYASLKRFICLK